MASTRDASVLGATEAIEALAVVTSTAILPWTSDAYISLASPPVACACVTSAAQLASALLTRVVDATSQPRMSARVTIDTTLLAGTSAWGRRSYAELVFAEEVILTSALE